MIYGIISLIMCVGIPVLGGIYLSARGRPVFWSFLAGMLSFALTQLVVRLPLLRYLSTHWDWFMLCLIPDIFSIWAFWQFRQDCLRRPGEWPVWDF